MEHFQVHGTRSHLSQLLVAEEAIELKANAEKYREFKRQAGFVGGTYLAFTDLVSKPKNPEDIQNQIKDELTALAKVRRGEARCGEER